MGEDGVIGDDGVRGDYAEGMRGGVAVWRGYRVVRSRDRRGRVLTCGDLAWAILCGGETQIYRMLTSIHTY